eukprot:TRINITY_DN31065_c0_g1_i1.p1 TRINITY_DN31065_c0_g1~~TRINITY_DN31065_c0_g1_i1.p1  ORF type:complete len:267 (-),score=33.70 TRINITY_DN31065_c0_g1_i1:229-1029(-)
MAKQLILKGLMIQLAFLPTEVRSFGSKSEEVKPPVARPASATTCDCPHPIYGDSVCYEPVCPVGYYRCGATSPEAPCYGIGGATLELSWRGYYECIKCEPGDFCDGCDTIKNCPDNDAPGRESPRVSPPGSTRIADCESCSVGMYANFARDGCAEKYTDVCDEKVIRRCIRFCNAEDPTRGKRLTPCERMKCEMYCSKQWSDACSERMKGYCIKSTQKTQEGLVGAMRMIEARIPNCDVDCDAAMFVGVTRSLFLVVAVSIAANQL